MTYFEIALFVLCCNISVGKLICTLIKKKWQKLIVFSIIISAHSIRCYKAIASKYDGDPDNFFNHEKYFVPENLVNCEQGVTHCTMIHGNGKISMTTLVQHNIVLQGLEIRGL